MVPGGTDTNTRVPIVVFSGGTPLDRMPSYAAAAEALALVARSDVPLVFCTSQTRAEIERTHQQLGIRHPFVAENGAAHFVPRGYFPFEVPHVREVAGYDVAEFGRPYADVVDVLHDTAERLGIGVVGFSDMSVEEVALECRVPLMHARLAKLREYDEPFRLKQPDAGDRRRLFRALASARLVGVAGPRYDHVGGAVDREAGVDWLTGLFRRAFGSVVTIGLGDSTNDVALLRRVNVPIIVDSGVTHEAWRLRTLVPSAAITPGTGAPAWADAILETVTALRCGRAPGAGRGTSVS